MKPLAIFDIDGTIFRSSLTIELFKALVAEKVFSDKSLKTVQSSETKWFDRQGEYDNYVLAIVEAYKREIKGKKVKQVVAVSRKVIREQRLRTYRYTLHLLQQLQQKCFTLAISGSPLEVVAEYNKFLGFDKFYGWEFGIDKQDRYTGKILHSPPFYKKELIARYIKSHGLSLRNSIGVGDTESDIGLLGMVAKPLAFNPNSVLAEHARKQGWKIIVERKDLIIEMEPKKVKFLKVK